MIDGRTTAHVIDECRAGWLDESRDIFGVGNRQEHSLARARARKRVPQAFWDRVAAQTRDAAHEEGEARNRNVSGRETVPGRYREEGGRQRGVGGRGRQKPSARICYAPRMSSRKP